MTTPVNFPIAKLLKEKEYKDKNILGTVRLEDCFNAPTIVSVVMWLYEKNGIWISVYSIDDSTIFRHCFSNIDFNSPTEAYEAAILYTLNNLI
jgi:hypothetical protein